MATWPVSLPQSLELPLTRKRNPGGKLRSDMDQGPAKQRTRFTANVKRFESQLTLTGAELTTFYAFHDDTLGQGATSFTWIDPITDASATLRFVDDPEDTLIAPHDDPDKRLYSVKMVLEILP